MNKTIKGFTLIELLVVIAIIGILSSVVLASLNTARDRGRNAAAQAELSGMRAQAEIDADTGTGIDYEEVCSSGQTLTMFNNAVGRVSGEVGEDALCNSNESDWAAYVTLLGDAGNFCVDSTGYAGGGFLTDGTVFECEQ